MKKPLPLSKTFTLERSVAETIDCSEFSDGAKRLIGLEREVPVSIGIDTSLRPKVVDSCGMSCTFCHNEGTPVAAARRNGDIFIPDIRYKGGRVSIFESTNGVDFLPGTMYPGDGFEEALGQIRASIGSSDLHLTGGEPTLHPRIADLVRTSVEAGYGVKMTSNGENGERVIRDCAEAGLSKINFSIFGTTPEELAEVQHPRFRSISLATAKINALDRSIRTALEHGVKVDANIVMSDPTHEQRVRRVIDRYAGSGVSVRILDDLDLGDVSYRAIYEMLAGMGATPEELHVEAGSSNARVKYMLPDGKELYFKQIRRTTLPETCSDCSLNTPDDCKEGYYGIRLYVDQSRNYKVGICLQRMDLTMPVEVFVTSALSKEIVDHRINEYNALNDHYGGRKSVKSERQH